MSPVFMRQRLLCLLILVHFPCKVIDYRQHVLYIRMTFFYKLQPVVVTQTHFMSIFVTARSTQWQEQDFVVVVLDMRSDVSVAVHL